MRKKAEKHNNYDDPPKSKNPLPKFVPGYAPGYMKKHEGYVKKYKGNIKKYVGNMKIRILPVYGLWDLEKF